METGNGPASCLRALAPEAPTSAGGDSGAAHMAQLRHALPDKGLPRKAAGVSAYWKHGVADHHERLD